MLNSRFVFGVVAVLIALCYQRFTGTKMRVLTQTTMRAAVYRSYGAPSDVLKVENNYPVPEIGASEVLVEVHACSINPIDWKKMQGFLEILEKLTGDLDSGSVTGFDFSGRVVGVGSGSSVGSGRLRVGDEVFGMAHVLKTGACAEFIAVDESLVSHKPRNLSHKQAASIPLAGLTSYQSLVHFGGLQYKSSNQSEQKVLILGGSGGTGSLGVQIARIMGAKVTSTCSARNNEMVIGLGAERTIDYRRENVYDVLEGGEFDVLYDCVGGADVPQNAHRVLKQQGQLVTIAGDKQKKFDVEELLTRGWQIVSRKSKQFAGGNGYHMVTANTNRQDLDVLAKWLEAADLQPVLDSEGEFTLDRIADAMEYSRAGRARGKIVVIVKQ